MDLSGPVPRRSRLHPDVFRPPHTPASTNDSRLQYENATGSSLTFSLKNSNGKRGRPSPGQTSLSTPAQTTDASWAARTPMLRSDMTSPDSLANTKYMLQGGLDTPSQEIDVMYDSFSSNKESDFRRRWSTGTSQADAPRRSMASTRLGEQNGRGRSVTTSVPQMSPPSGWSSAVFSLVGSMAGRMWSFCNTTVFSGFQAGGGQRFELQQEEQSPEGRHLADHWEDEDTSVQDYTAIGRCPSPMPGMWPEADIDEDRLRCESPSKRPAKRIHVDSGQGWVLVETVATGPRHRDLSPMKKRLSTAQSSTVSRPVPKATPRRSYQAHSRRTSAAASLTHNNVTQSPSISRKHNYLSPVSAHRASSTDNVDQSPTVVEAQRYAARVKREEQQNDASLRRLNDRLSAMIKEGKEALGTKVEIVDGLQCEDEGYSEGVFG